MTFQALDRLNAVHAERAPSLLLLPRRLQATMTHGAATNVGGTAFFVRKAKRVDDDHKRLLELKSHSGATISCRDRHHEFPLSLRCAVEKLCSMRCVKIGGTLRQSAGYISHRRICPNDVGRLGVPSKHEPLAKRLSDARLREWGHAYLSRFISARQAPSVATIVANAVEPGCLHPPPAVALRFSAQTRSSAPAHPPFHS